MDKEIFRKFNIEEQLDGEDEFIVGYELDDVIFMWYGQVEAYSEEKAKEKVRKDKLFDDVPHTVNRIYDVMSLDDSM